MCRDDHIHLFVSYLQLLVSFHQSMLTFTLLFLYSTGRLPRILLNGCHPRRYGRRIDHPGSYCRRGRNGN